MLLQLHHTDAYLPITDGRAGQKTALPSSSYALSCPLHLLIQRLLWQVWQQIAIQTISRRAPTGDAAEPSSLFTHGTVKKMILNFHLCWAVMKIF